MAFKDTHCGAAHYGGYGDCTKPKGHDGEEHQDAHSHTFSNSDNKRILLSRQQFSQQAAERKK